MPISETKWVFVATQLKNSSKKGIAGSVVETDSTVGKKNIWSSADFVRLPTDNFFY